MEQYPIIDEILLKMFKMIVPLPLAMQLSNQETLEIQSIQELLEYLC